MSNQLTLPQQKANTVVLALQNLGYKVNSHDENKITFYYKNSLTTFYLSNDWVAGDAIKPGKGLPHLLQEIKFR